MSVAPPYPTLAVEHSAASEPGVPEFLLDFIVMPGEELCDVTFIEVLLHINPCTIALQLRLPVSLEDRLVMYCVSSQSAWRTQMQRTRRHAPLLHAVVHAALRSIVWTMPCTTAYDGVT